MKKYKLFTHNAAPDGTGSAVNAVDGSARETDPVPGSRIRNDACATDASILMVDDEPINMEVVQAYLEDAGYSNFITTSDSTCAMDIIRQKKPDVILLDLVMPEVTGFDILEQLQSDESLAYIPVIVLTSSDDSETKLQCLQFGAADFLAKPVDSSELVLRLRNTVRAKAYQDHLVYYDSLTGLPNRRRFAELLELALDHAERTGEGGAILHMDLDHFKKINDTLGHSAGDELLKQASQRLERRIRDGDSLGRLYDIGERVSMSRLGGDEFTILLPDMGHEQSAAYLARRILDAMTVPFEINGNELFVTPSIGISIFPEDGKDVDTLLKHADIAMYQAKQHGRNGFEFYSSEMNARSLEQLNMEAGLRTALDSNELQLYYQPKLDVMNGGIVGAEALLRWEHPEMGMVSPVDFIPLAEETGMIVPIGARVLKMACRQARAWQDAGYGSLQMAVNVSIRQLQDSKLVKTVQAALEESGLQPQDLTIELTENMLMENAEDSFDKLQQLKGLGVKISIDDFGTGYSSLAYLQKFTIDELKIDRSFIQQIEAGTDKAPIVEAVVAMARSLNLAIVAEGVETCAQLEYLQKKECDVYQGFLFSKPVPADEFANLLAGTRSDVPDRPDQKSSSQK